MGFWSNLFNVSNEPEELTPQSEPAISYEEIPGTLDLGWYYSETKNELQMAKIRQDDRATHLYVIGATGTGKTKFLEFLIAQDIKKGNGFGVIDPHGDLIEDIKGILSLRYGGDDPEIAEKAILIDPTDPDYTVTFNPLEKLSGTSIAEQANELVGCFRKIWSDSWGVRMEDLMRNSLIALGEAELSLAELPPFMTRRSFRSHVLAKVTHPLTRDYFTRFDTMTDRAQITWIEPVMNKINAFFADERIRQMFSSARSSFHIREVMDQRKMLLVKLDKGKLKDSADLLGSLLMAKIQVAAFSRSDIPKNKRTPFYLYIDEFQNFATESFGVILSEARKYGLSLIMAHQTLAQISTELRSLILGNTGLEAYFRINRQDASLLAKEAFRYSGYEVKRQSLHGTRYWSLGEEWERYTKELQDLPPRICYIKHKSEGGMIPVQTVEITPAWEVLEMPEEEYSDILNQYPFGQKYLVPRETLVTSLYHERVSQSRAIEGTTPPALPAPEPAASQEQAVESPQTAIDTHTVKKAGKEGPTLDERSFLQFVMDHPGMFVTKIYRALKLSGYKGDKLKAGLTAKGLVAQEETRAGRGGRLAKILTPTEKAASIFQEREAPLTGKGGELHKHLQIMLKEQAEVLGWKAVIEEKIARSLETVDVGLRKGDLWIAVEISATTGAGQEMQNIRKCFDAGYDFVFSACENEKKLSSLKAEARKNFTFKERERIRFVSPGEVKDALQTVTPSAIVSEKPIVSGQIRGQKLLTVTETAEFLGISKNTLYEWIVQKKVPHYKVGRLVKFKREELEAWLMNQGQQENKSFH